MRTRMHQPAAIVMFGLWFFTIHIERTRPHTQLVCLTVRLRAQACKMIADALAARIQGLLQGLIENSIIFNVCIRARICAIAGIRGR